MPRKKSGGGAVSNQKAETRAVADQRARQALRLRSEGKTFHQIAEALGYTNEGNAYRAWERGWQQAVKPDVERTRSMILSQLERVIEAHMPRAIGEDGSDPDPRSADIILKALDRAAKLLGADAPQKVEQTVTHFDGEKSELDRTIIELANKFSPDHAGIVTARLGIRGEG